MDTPPSLTAATRLVRAWTAVVALLIILAVAPQAVAQIPDAKPNIRPLGAGPFLLYPLFSVELEQTDNVFRSGTSPVQSSIVSLGSGVLAEVPFRESSLELGYALRYRDYSALDIDERLSHFFRAAGEFRFGSGFVAGFSEDYQRGVLDTGRFDPGGEITFRGERFEANAARAEFGHDRATRRRLRLWVEADRVDFVREEVFRPGPTFFDTTASRVGASGEHRSGARLWLVWEVSGGSSDLSRPVAASIDFRERRNLELALGARWALSPGSELVLRPGWNRSRFEAVRDSEFEGLVGSIRFVRSVPAGVRVAVQFDRRAYPSVYADHNYYVTNQASAQLQTDNRARVILGGRLVYGTNRYPDGTIRREDRILDGTVWIGYRLWGNVEFRVYGRSIERSGSASSLVEPGVFDYDEMTFGTTIRLGG